MNKKFLGLFIFILLAFVLVSPFTAKAQDARGSDTGPSPQETGNGGGGGVTIKSMVDAAVKAAFYIAGGIVVILWLVTGILFLTAQGNPEGLSKAKKALFMAVAGTVICIVAGGAVSLVSSVFNL